MTHQKITEAAIAVDALQVLRDSGLLATTEESEINYKISQLIKLNKLTKKQVAWANFAKRVINSQLLPEDS